MAEDCSKALIQDKIDYNADIHTRLSVLNIIDRSTYDKAKRERGAAANIIVEGVPLSGTANYDDFSERRTREFSEYRFNEQVDNSIRYSSQVLGPNALSAYRECLRSRATEGLVILPEEFSDDLIILEMKFLPKGSSEPQAVRVLDTKGLSTGKKEIKEQIKEEFPDHGGKLPPNEWGTLALVRPNPEGEARIILKIPSYKSSSYKIAAKPVIYGKCAADIKVTMNYPPGVEPFLQRVPPNRKTPVHDNNGDQFAACNTDDRCFVQAHRIWGGANSQTGFEEKEAFANAVPSDKSHWVRCTVTRRYPPPKL